MTVRELIEHLAQYEPDLEIKIRDQNDGTILNNVESHAVELERVGDAIFDESNLVVVIG